MTNEEKWRLKDYIKRGWTFQRIRRAVSCHDATIKKYIKIFRPEK